MLISHLSRESRAAVAGKPGLAGYRSSSLQTALGGHANLSRANQKTNGLELLERHWVKKPSHEAR